MRQARQVQRHHRRHQGAPARHGQRAAQPRELGAHRDGEGRGRGGGQQSWRAMRSSRLRGATPWRLRARRASRPSRTPAGPCATRTRSTCATSTASRSSPPVTGTSATRETQRARGARVDARRILQNPDPTPPRPPRPSSSVRPRHPRATPPRRRSHLDRRRRRRAIARDPSPRPPPSPSSHRGVDARFSAASSRRPTPVWTLSMSPNASPPRRIPTPAPSARTMGSEGRSSRQRRRPRRRRLAARTRPTKARAPARPAADGWWDGEAGFLIDETRAHRRGVALGGGLRVGIAHRSQLGALDVEVGGAGLRATSAAVGQSVASFGLPPLYRAW